jgi:hypothetical protein
MNYDYSPTGFSKSILTGLFAGITTTLLCLVFNYIYRYNTGFTLSMIINIPAIIFSCHLLLLICGMLYPVFKRVFRSGLVFSAFFICVTLFCLWATTGVQRSSDAVISAQFRGLLSGDIIIMGAGIFLLIPLLFNSKVFEREVL